jgi:hypothetical protein
MAEAEVAATAVREAMMVADGPAAPPGSPVLQRIGPD